MRLISLTFFGTPNAARVDYTNAHEQSVIVAIPYIILALLSIFFGYVASDLFTGPGSDMLDTALFTHPNHNSIIEAHYGIPTGIKLLPLLVTTLGAVAAIVGYNKYPDVLRYITNTTIGLAVYRFFNAK